MFYILLTIMWDKSKLENIFSQFMKELNLDLTDASLKDTPKRVAKMFIDETCNWLFTEPPRITVFPNDWSYDQMVLVRDIQVQSLCEHHFQPFIWKAYIAYIPKDKVVWLSKFARVIDYFARRPQVQERLSKEIADYIEKKLNPQGIIVYIDRGEHLCMKMRGVENHTSEMITSEVRGKFLEKPELETKFLEMIKWRRYI